MVKIEIPVSEEAAAILADPSKAEDIGRVITSMLVRRRPDVERLRAVIAEIKADARAAGLTDQDIDDELAAFKAERRR